MLSDGLYNFLKTNGGVSALVASRIYPLIIPQSVYSEASKQPCLVYSIDTDDRILHYDGSEKLVTGRLQIDCYARSYSASQNLAAAVRAALVDYSGSMVSNTSPATATAVQRVFLDGEVSLTDEEPGLYRVMQRYVIWYDET